MTSKSITRRQFSQLALGCTTTATPADAATGLINQNSKITFTHGVASGDPTQTGFIIWTRINPEAFIANEKVIYQISETLHFENIQYEGTVSNNIFGPQTDFTVKVDLERTNANLDSGKTYFYRFSYNGEFSRVGRTITLPENPERIKIAVISCQDYGNGFYHVYKDMVARDEIDLVLFLGDFIYESIRDSRFQEDRRIDRNISLSSGNKVAKKLADFRELYQTYKSDPLLQDAMAKFPFICTWDDHETANDTYWDYQLDTLGAPNHPFDRIENPERRKKKLFQLKLDAMKAWSEYIPARIEIEDDSHPHKYYKIYRKFELGDLADLFVTDARSYKEPNGCLTVKGESIFAKPCALPDSGKIPSKLGNEQTEWFKRNITQSKASWRVWGNQMLFGQWAVKDLGGNLRYINHDAWDGWHLDRKRLLEYFAENNVHNLLILTGDMHSSIVSKVKEDYNAPIWRRNKTLGYEVLTPAVTSKPAAELVRKKIRDFIDPKQIEKSGPIESVISKLFNPHFEYVNMDLNGYTTVEISKESALVEVHKVDTLNPEKPAKTIKRFNLKNPSL